MNKWVRSGWRRGVRGSRADQASLGDEMYFYISYMKKPRRKKRSLTLIEDECLACLAFFAYSTGRTTREALVESLALTTRLDEKCKGTREGWWEFKFDNMHYAFKSSEGTEIRGKRLPKTDKRGAESGPGLQRNLRDYSIKYFYNVFSLCVELARRALDAPLPEALEKAVFEDTDGLPSRGYLSPGDVQALEEASPEGIRKLRQHWYLERDSSLPRRAKEAFEARHGELFCEACGLRPVPTYGHPLVDAHHRLPLSQYAAASKMGTTPSDFAILCPSCHRAVHKHVDCDVDAVRKGLSANGLVVRRLT